MQEILSITPSREGVDPWLWRGGVEEGYSVKDTYKFIRRFDEMQQNRVFKALWRCKALSKAIVFSWRVILDRIKSKEALWKRNIGMVIEDLQCPLCSKGTKTFVHLLSSCKFSY